MFHMILFHIRMLFAPLTGVVARPGASRSGRAANMLEYALLGLLAVGLFVLFRDQAQNLINSLWDRITGDTGLNS